MTSQQMARGDEPFHEHRTTTSTDANGREEVIAVRNRNFCLLEGTLYHKGHDGIWRRCVRNYEKEAVLREAHCGIAGGHYAGDTNV